MADAPRWPAAWARAGYLLAGAWAVPICFGQGTVGALLPETGAAPGWSRDGEPQEYVGEDLYAYIDGGAEIYQEYGFRRVVLQDYKNASGKSVSLEIFEMETPAAAYGMFTFKRSGKGKSVPLGSGADLEDYYLNFWKGRFVVTLTGFDETAATIDGILAVGGAVDAKIADKSDLPALVEALPEAGLKLGSVKYLKGLLGLNNVYPFYTARGLNFLEAIQGDYEGGAMLIVMEYAAVEARDKAWAELRGYLENSDRFKRPVIGEKVPLFRDSKGIYLAFAQAGPRLLVGISPDLSASIAIVRQSR